MADILIAVLNIWFILVLIKPSKFLFFVKSEAKWKRLKGFGCYILLSIVIAAFSGGSSKPATSTTEPVKEEKPPVVAEGVLAKDDPLRRLALLKPNKKWIINKNNHSYDSLPDVGIDDNIYSYTDDYNCPRIEAVLYNNTDKEQEVLWQLRFYEKSKDKQTDQYERIILPPKSIHRFETYCKYKATMEGVVVSCSARKIDDPPSGKFTKVLNPWLYGKYTKPTFNDTPAFNNSGPKITVKNEEEDLKIIETNYQADDFVSKVNIRIKNTSDDYQYAIVRVVARDKNTNDIMRDEYYRYGIPTNETIIENANPLLSSDDLNSSNIEITCFKEKKDNFVEKGLKKLDRMLRF